MEIIEVGRCYPQIIGRPEGIRFEITNGGAEIKIYLQDPTQKEIEQMGAGSKLEMKFLFFRGIIFMFIKFGNLQWMDAPYNIHLGKEVSGIPKVKKGKCLSTKILLFDVSTGKLCKMRMTGIPSDVCNQFSSMLEEQRKQSFNIDECKKNIYQVYAAYSTKELRKMAPIGFKI